MTTDPARFDLTGKTALVTGATRGIGLAIARGLGEHGARVIITGRKKETLAPAGKELSELGLEVKAVPCHQGEPIMIRELFEDLESLQWSPDVVVINAATNPVYGPLLAMDLQAWHKIVDVNLTGSLITAQLAAQQMIQDHGGSITFISSVAALEPIRGLGGYSISKAGMLGMMRALALELGPDGVRVNAIAPGLVETQFSSALFDNKVAYNNLIGNLPLRRHGQPEDMVGLAVFLASDAASYVTGQTFVVDGGGRM